MSALADKTGKKIVSLDLTGFEGAISDNFVICHATSTTQVAALADGTTKKASDLATALNVSTQKIFILSAPTL